MPRYQVPQFIETEIKIVGPFTLKQFLWLAGGAAIVFFLYMIIKGILFFILAVPIGGFCVALAFVKIDGVPLLNYLASALSYLISPKKYTYGQAQQPNQTIDFSQYTGEPKR